MSAPEDVRGEAPGDVPGAAELERATALLREHTDEGWTSARGGVLRAATSALRSSPPVRGRHRLGDYLVSSDVVVSRLRVAVDAVGSAAADRVECTTDEDDRLVGLRVDLVATYGTLLPELADHVRRLVAQVLEDVLGPSRVRTDVRVVDLL